METEEVRDILGNEFAFIFNEINPVIQGLEIEKKAKILDIGTGVGWMAITLALNDYEVITGEPEDDVSEYAKRDWLENAKKAKVEQMIAYTPFNAENMPFDTASFDAIFILGALHHIDDKEATLKESERVMRVDGIICIMEPNKNLMNIIRENKFSSHPDPVDPREYARGLQLSLELIEGQYYDTYILRKQ